MTFTELDDKICTNLIGSKFLGVTKVGEYIKEVVGKDVSCYDQYIDDGADDDETEDEYVMCAAYQTEDMRLTIRVYYGDVTREIGYVDVFEN